MPIGGETLIWNHETWYAICDGYDVRIDSIYHDVVQD